MILIHRAAAVLLAIGLLVWAAPGQAQDYEPQAGDSAVVYINQFKADQFEAAQQIMVEAFGRAMSDAGQTRRTFWLANPESHEIVGVSFFEQGESVDDWHQHAARQQVLERLEPLRRSPQILIHYQVIGAHRTGP